MFTGLWSLDTLSVSKVCFITVMNSQDTQSWFAAVFCTECQESWSQTLALICSIRSVHQGCTLIEISSMMCKAEGIVLRGISDFKPSFFEASIMR